MMLDVLLLAAALTGASAAPAASASASGHWEGVMRRGSSQLAVRFDLAADGSRGRFSAPDLGAIDIPLSHVRLGSRVHWELDGDATTTVFDGAVRGDDIAGSFRENARTGTLRLHRTRGAVAHPYGTEAVTFANGDVRLAGTVYAPRTPGKHPAAVLVHGSGPEGRWANAYIADDLARRGIVALVYDKRGVGDSGGDWRTSTLETLAEDARAAVHVLAQRSDVDTARVGVYGHSQGAEIAPLIAENDREVTWIGAADGPIGPLYRQDLYRVDTLLAKRYSGQTLADAKALYAEFVDTARAGAPHEQLRAAIAKAGDAPWVDVLAIPEDSNWIWAWYAKVGDFDNTSAWAAVSVPVLLLFGSDDALVPPGESIADTVRALKVHGNAHVSVRVFAGADHTLRVPPRDPDGWPHNAAGFPAVLAAFAQNPHGHAR